eukprot:scaffold47658_cov32-Tisochrysis_lutea.AAC.2
MHTTPVNPLLRKSSARWDPFTSNVVSSSSTSMFSSRTAMSAGGRSAGSSELSKGAYARALVSQMSGEKSRVGFPPSPTAATRLGSTQRHALRK